MLKNISNLGTTLNKSEQQSINGGDDICKDYFILPCPGDLSGGRDEYCNCI